MYFYIYYMLTSISIHIIDQKTLPKKKHKARPTFRSCSMSTSDEVR